MASQMAAFLGDILPELILAGGAIVVLMVALFTPLRMQPRMAFAAALVLAISALFAVFDLMDPPGPTFFNTLAADGLGRWATLLLLTLALLVIALSVDWFRSDHRQGEYYTMVLFGTLGAVLLAGATDLMEMVLAMLLNSVAGYTLAGFHRRSRSSSEAAIKYFLVGALANGALLYGVALLFGISGSTTFTAMTDGLVDADPVALVVGFGLVAIGVAFKMGAVPVHAWVPDVAEGAPAPAAAFLMVAGKVGALVFLTRLVLVMPETGVGWRPLMALLAAVTMTLGNLSALRQDDVRRMLGWSAVSQVGYGLLAVVAVGRSELAVPALLMFLAAYTFATVAVFGVVVQLRGLTSLSEYAGLARTRPWLSGALVVGFLSFVGIPPLGGFAAKLLLMAAVIDSGYTWLAILTVINSAISLVYYLRVLGPAYVDEAQVERPVIGRAVAVSIGIAAVAVMAVGIGAQPLIEAWSSLDVPGG